MRLEKGPGGESWEYTALDPDGIFLVALSPSLASLHAALCLAAFRVNFSR